MKPEKLNLAKSDHLNPKKQIQIQISKKINHGEIKDATDPAFLRMIEAKKQKENNPIYSRIMSMIPFVSTYQAWKENGGVNFKTDAGHFNVNSPVIKSAANDALILIQSAAGANAYGAGPTVTADLGGLIGAVGSDAAIQYAKQKGIEVPKWMEIGIPIVAGVYGAKKGVGAYNSAFNPKWQKIAYNTNQPVSKDIITVYPDAALDGRFNIMDVMQVYENPNYIQKLKTKYNLNDKQIKEVLDHYRNNLKNVQIYRGHGGPSLYAENSNGSQVIVLNDFDLPEDFSKLNFLHEGLHASSRYGTSLPKPLSNADIKVIPSDKPVHHGFTLGGEPRISPWSRNHLDYVLSDDELRVRALLLDNYLSHSSDPKASLQWMRSNLKRRRYGTNEGSIYRNYAELLELFPDDDYLLDILKHIVALGTPIGMVATFPTSNQQNPYKNETIK